MGLYVYENHLGGVYFDKDYNENWLETCDQCGDSDRCFGEFKSATDFIEWIKDVDGYLPYDESTIMEDWKHEEDLK